MADTGHFLLVKGLPITCNSKKIQMKFEAECGVHIQDINVEPDVAKIRFQSSEDLSKFRKRFPNSIKFGNDCHALTIISSFGSDSSESNSQNYAQASSTEQRNCFAIQTWSSVVELPQCKSGIVVQSGSKTMTIDDVFKYFGNSQASHGGDILDIIPMVDGLFISFKDESVAREVWNFRPHRINGKAVVVYLKRVPEQYKNKLVVKCHQQSMNEEQVYHLLARSRKSIQPKVKKNESGAFLCEFENDIDEAVISNIFENFQQQTPDFKMSFLVMSDCIELKSENLELMDHEVKMLFENRHHTGGGNVTRIDRCESSLLVYFDSYEDARMIAKTWPKSGLQVFDVSVKGRPYFHDLYVSHCHARENSIDSFLTGLFLQRDEMNGKEDASVARPFLYDKIDQNVVYFLKEHPKHSDSLKKQLQSIGQGKVTNDGIKIYLKLNSPENESVAKGRMKSFLQHYTSMKVTVLNEEMRTTISSKSSSHDLLLRWSRHHDEVIVTGLKVEVESFLKSLQPFSMFKHLLLEPQEIRWFVETGSFDQLKKDHRSIVRIEGNNILFRVSDSEVAEAENAIKMLVQKLARRKFPSEKKIAEFLVAAEEVPSIYHNVSKLMVKGTNTHTILVVKNKTSFLLGLEECGDMAQERLTTALAFDECIQLEKSKIDAQPKLWKILSEYESQGFIRTSVEDGFVVSIAGFKEHVKEAKKKLSCCADTFRKEIKIESGNLKFISTYFAFKTLCMEHSVMHEITRNGILLKGKMDALEKVASHLKKWQDEISKKTVTIEMLDLSNFLKSKDGQALLCDVETKHRASILSRPLPSQKQRAEQAMGQASTAPERCSAMIGKIKVSVLQGDITEERNDAIVNSVSENFDLSKGSLSRLIVKKGGQAICDEIKKRHENQIRVTSSGKLPCKKVLHVLFPESSQGITTCFGNLFKEAESRKCRSISIPAILSGSPQRGRKNIAKLMLQSAKDFEKKNQHLSYLRTIDIVLSTKEQLVVYKEELCLAADGGDAKVVMSQPVTLLKRSTGTSVGDSDQNGFLKIGGITVAVREGDITEETNHAIVNSTGLTFDLSKGMVSKAIVSKGGTKIQGEVRAMKGKFVRVTGAGTLKCIKIIHVASPPKLMEIGDRLYEVLQLAEKQMFPTLSVPAIGAGVLKQPVTEVAKIMLKAIEDFAQRNPTKYLKRVDFVIFDSEQVKEFRDAAFIGTKEDAASYESDCVEFSIFNLKKDMYEAEKAATYLHDQISQQLSHNVVDDAIDDFGQAEDKLLKKIGERFHVILSRSEGEIKIEGLEENRVEAEKELKSLLENFVVTSASCSPVWEYREMKSPWKKFNFEESEQLEKAHQEFKHNGSPPLISFTLNGKSFKLNLETKKMQNYELRRTEQAAVYDPQPHKQSSVKCTVRKDLNKHVSDLPPVPKLNSSKTSRTLSK